MLAYAGVHVLSVCTRASHKSSLYMLVGIDNARFRGQVLPGDQLQLEVLLKRTMRGIGMFDCKALVDGKVVAEAEMMCSSQDRNT